MGGIVLPQCEYVSLVAYNLLISKSLHAACPQENRGQIPCFFPGHKVIKEDISWKYRTYGHPTIKQSGRGYRQLGWLPAVLKMQEFHCASWLNENLNLAVPDLNPKPHPSGYPTLLQSVPTFPAVEVNSLWPSPISAE